MDFPDFQENHFLLRECKYAFPCVFSIKWLTPLEVVDISMQNDYMPVLKNQNVVPFIFAGDAEKRTR